MVQRLSNKSFHELTDLRICIISQQAGGVLECSIHLALRSQPREGNGPGTEEPPEGEKWPNTAALPSRDPSPALEQGLKCLKVEKLLKDLNAVSFGRLQCT